MLGHLRVRESGEVEEEDGAALTRRQLRDRLAHARREARGLGELGRPGLRRREIVQRDPAPTALAQGAAADVERDADQPGPEARVVAQALQAQQRLDHGLLGGLRGGVPVAGHAAAGGEHLRVMALHQLREGAPVAAAGGGDQRGVVWARGSGHLR